MSYTDYSLTRVAAATAVATSIRGRIYREKPNLCVGNFDRYVRKVVDLCRFALRYEKRARGAIAELQNYLAQEKQPRDLHRTLRLCGIAYLWFDSVRRTQAVLYEVQLDAETVGFAQERSLPVLSEVRQLIEELAVAPTRLKSAAVIAAAYNEAWPRLHENIL